MERKTKFEIGEFYHLYNRGVEKRIIFKNIKDYRRFLALLYISNSSKQIHISNEIGHGNHIEDIFNKDRGSPIVAIGAYCLMPNHFHLLVTPLVKEGISKFMLKMQTGYSMYFNIKNDRVGSLFQGTFKSQHIDNDRFLRYVYAYLHLNHAKLKKPNWKIQTKNLSSDLKKFIAEYPFSSLQEYLSENYKIINPELFPVDKKYITDYGSMIDDFIEFDGDFIKDNP